MHGHIDGKSCRNMAGVAAGLQSPAGSDAELADILRQAGGAPAVVVRADSGTSAELTDPLDNGVAAAAAAGDRLYTPAPMADFEVLSDVESDMEDAATPEVSEISRDKSRFDDEDDDDDVKDNGSMDHDRVPDVATEANELLNSQNDVAAHIPSLVFEDVDANVTKTLSSPECIVNNDYDNYDDEDSGVQQTWEWTASDDQGQFTV